MMIFKKRKIGWQSLRRNLLKKGEKPQPESDPIAEPQQKKLKIKKKKRWSKKKKDDSYVMKKTQE